MNWKYTLGLILIIPGTILVAAFYNIFYAFLPYLLGVAFILDSGKSAKVKRLAILVPLTVMGLLWIGFWMLNSR